MIEAVKPGGVVLDLQVIRPNPTVEINGRAHFEINGDPLFVKADAATAAIDQLVLAGRLLEQATDDHDVRQHYENGTELIADFTDKSRTLPKSAITYLRETTQPCAIRADSGNYASHTPAITPREHHPDPTTVPPREAGSGRNTTTATSAKHSYSILQLLSLPSGRHRAQDEPSPVPTAATASERPCKPTPASTYTYARAATRRCAQRPETAASSAPTPTNAAHQNSKQARWFEPLVARLPLRAIGPDSRQSGTPM
jgi:hypothetical protein